MKTLVLLRHAKSSWDDASLGDFDRPLAERGTRDAPRVGRELSARVPSPDFIISSPAVRARQTIEAVAKAAGYTVGVGFDEHIYAASSAELLKIVRAFPETSSTAIIVGHNPGFEDLLSRLTGTQQHMGTCNVACIKIGAKKWEDVEDGIGKIDWLLKPKK